MSKPTRGNLQTVPMHTWVTLQDVLAPPELELKLVNGDADCLANTVRGAHFTEILEPKTWLEEQWIMITAGVEMYRDATKQRQLVRELTAMNAAALGYCSGIRTKSIPSALLAEARALGLPVFEVPLRVPVRLVVTHVHRLVLGTEEELFQRAVALTDYLLTGFDEPDPSALVPESCVVDRLRALLDVQSDLIDVHGRPVEHEDNGARGGVDFNRLATELPAQGSRQLTVQGTELLVVPCRIGARLNGWIVVYLRTNLAAGSFMLAVAEAAAKLVAVAALSRKQTPENLELLGQHLITHLLRTPARPVEGLGGLAETRALPILQQLGFTIDKLVRAFVVQGSATSSQRLASSLHACGFTHAWSTCEDELIAVVQCPDEATATIAGRFAAPTGIGGPVPVTELRVSVRQARYALRLLRTDRQGRDSAECGLPDHLDYTALPPASVLADQLGEVLDEGTVDDYLAPLLAQPLVLEAVTQYLRHDQDTVATARSLHLHPNSLRHRLDRLNTLLGASIRRPSVLASLYLCLTNRGLL